MQKEDISWHFQEAPKQLWVEKYRPKTLDDVVGNKGIISTLKNVAKAKNFVHLLFTLLLLTLLANTQIINATQQEEFFSWSGTLSWLSQNKQHFSKYSNTSKQVRLVLSAPETLKVYIQSSDDFQKSGLSGWIIVYSHWNTETAELDYTYTIPFADT